MNNNNKFKTWFAVSVLAIAIGSMSGLQAKQSPIQLQSVVQELVEKIGKDGKKQVVAVKPDQIVPGDRIMYTTTFKNAGDQPSDNIVIVNAIPKHTQYLPRTAQGQNCLITFSVDGGKTWDVPDELKVKGKDGKWRAATATDYTHIRWAYKPSLKPKEVKRVSFQTRLL